MTRDARLEHLSELIAGWPGLVARPDPRLVADSLVLVPLLGAARSVVDVGSGGGLPGLALKLARPDLQLTLVEANRRKAAFLVHACAVLELPDVRVVARRAEEVGQDPTFRESFDTAVARALAAMPVLAELCLPLVRPGGLLLAMKTSSEAETEGARAAVELLGGRIRERVAAPSSLRASGEVVVVEKVARTPEAYPRRAGVPNRHPLGK